MSNDPWTCPICNRSYPVISLATDCQARHEDAPKTVNSR